MAVKADAIVVRSLVMGFVKVGLRVNSVLLIHTSSHCIVGILLESTCPSLINIAVLFVKTTVALIQRSC